MHRISDIECDMCAHSPHLALEARVRMIPRVHSTRLARALVSTRACIRLHPILLAELRPELRGSLDQSRLRSLLISPYLLSLFAISIVIKEDFKGIKGA